MAGAELESRYQRTYELLLDRCGASVAQQYFSAMVVFADPAIPCRHAMAAHELREMINRLPEVSDVPVVDTEGPRVFNISNDLRNLVPAWKEAWRVADWSDPVDWPELCKRRRARRVLDRLHKTMAAVAGLPVAAERLLKAAPGFDPNPIKATEDAYKITMRQLLESRDYFVRVAHRPAPPSDAEFLVQVDRLVLLVREVFAAAPLEDFLAIDRAMAEVQDGG